ncbi:MAG: hypothetical protein ACT4O9_03895 [Blastocatellia bacterium]
MKPLLYGMFLLIPALAYGQGSGSVSPAPNRDGSPENNFPENNFVVTRSANGTIASLQKGVLIIKDKRNKEIRVLLTKDTKFKVGKKTVKVDELDESRFAQGNEIKVTYVPNLKNPTEFLAIEVRVPDSSKEKPVLAKT